MKDPHFDNDYCRWRRLPDGRVIGIYIQLFNVALHLYPPDSKWYWMESW